MTIGWLFRFFVVSSSYITQNRSTAAEVPNLAHVLTPSCSIKRPLEIQNCKLSQWDLEPKVIYTNKLSSTEDRSPTKRVLNWNPNPKPNLDFWPWPFISCVLWSWPIYAYMQKVKVKGLSVQKDNNSITSRANAVSNNRLLYILGHKSVSGDWWKTPESEPMIKMITLDLRISLIMCRGSDVNFGALIPLNSN